MTEREFTVEQANAMLPSLVASLERVRAARQVVLSGAKRIKRWAGVDGGGRQGREYLDALDMLRREIGWISEQGIILRDPEAGIVDFPSRREGAKVLLCWRLGEGQVEHWHTEEGGFAARRRL